MSSRQPAGGVGSNQYQTRGRPTARATADRVGRFARRVTVNDLHTVEAVQTQLLDPDLVERASILAYEGALLANPSRAAGDGPEPGIEWETVICENGIVTWHGTSRIHGTLEERWMELPYAVAAGEEDATAGWLEQMQQRGDAARTRAEAAQAGQPTRKTPDVSPPDPRQVAALAKLATDALPPGHDAGPITAWAANPQLARHTINVLNGREGQLTWADAARSGGYLLEDTYPSRVRAGDLIIVGTGGEERTYAVVNALPDTVSVAFTGVELTDSSYAPIQAEGHRVLLDIDNPSLRRVIRDR